jgi:hypothetical protein
MARTTSGYHHDYCQKTLCVGEAQATYLFVLYDCFYCYSDSSRKQLNVSASFRGVKRRAVVEHSSLSAAE